MLASLRKLKNQKREERKVAFTRLNNSTLPRVFPGGSAGKESACSAGGPVRFRGWEARSEEGLATLPSTLAWRTLVDREPGGRSRCGAEADAPERLSAEQRRHRLRLAKLAVTLTHPGTLNRACVLPTPRGLPWSPWTQPLRLLGPPRPRPPPGENCSGLALPPPGQLQTSEQVAGGGF